MSMKFEDDSGFTLIEMSVALILSAMVVATFVSVFFSFSQNAGDANGQAEHQEQARQVIARVVVDLRQAVTADPNGRVIESLTADRLVFYTMVRDQDLPIRIVYERSGCVAGECELVVKRYAVTDFNEGTYTFASTPFEESHLMAGVLADQPLFGGLDWVGDPKVKTTVAACGGSGPECDFPLVSVTLRSVPFGTSEGGRTPLEIREEVRMRNA
jgi:prepilin-type N-terminal cleavage/methylation domain-containing protein